MYQASPGDVIEVEMTAENHEKNTQTEYLTFYVSANGKIRSTDTAIDTRSITLSPLLPYTRTYQVTLPATLTPGDVVWVGARIDDGGALGEVREDNNAICVAGVEVL